MKVSLSWLRTYTDLEMDVGRLAHKLTMAGLEVEAVYDRYAFLDNVLVGRITAVGSHPRADKLTLCQVDTGERQHRVVCKAPNAAQGMLAPLALPGTVLIDGSILTAATIRGEHSHGMLCSEAELGLGPDGSGLMVLDGNLTPGTPLNRALNLSDPVLDIDLTPNRPDCLSFIGIAREIAAFQGTSLRRPAIDLPETQGHINDHASVVIEAPDHCPRYTARLMEQITVGPSPFWLQDRLLSVGLRPINNLVDITNFVMLETGQPLHAFDFDQLAKKRIVVRTARKGELFTTLDEKERQLDAQMVMICDGQRAVGIGGVMGGMNSQIEPTTTRVLLESAYFDAASIRKTAKKLGLNTDASHRFERGMDAGGTLLAIDRAAALITELGKGRLRGGTIDVQHSVPQPPVIDLSVRATNRVLGTDLKMDLMAGLLKSVEFGVRPMDDQTIRVRTPSFRVDVSRPQDLMEEVARLWGYEKIPTTFSAIPVKSAAPPKWLLRCRRVRELLVGLGFSEAINYSFIHSASCDRLEFGEDDPRRRTVRLLNPLTEDQTVLRTSLIAGLLETMQRNIVRQSKTLRLFEIGNIYLATHADAQPDEQEMLAGLWTGQRQSDGWYARPEACDYYDLKGVVETLLTSLKVRDTQFARLETDQCTYSRPGASAEIRIAGETVGLIGEVRPRVLKTYNLKQAAFVFELNLRQLLEHVPDVVFARPLSRYPSVTRDATLIVDQKVEADTLIRHVRQLDQSLVEDVRLFDLFHGHPVPVGHKSVSLRIVYQSETQTLEDDSVNRLHKEITAKLVAHFKASLPA